MTIERLKNRGKSVILAFLLCGFLSHQASVFSATPPNTFYVAKIGNDSNSGTIDSPVLSIRHCVSMMTAGDTCYIRGGTYSESGSFTYGNPGVPVGTSYSNAITIAAYPGETVVWTNGWGDTIFALQTTAPSGRTSFYWIVDGIIFDGAKVIKWTIGGYNGDYVRMKNCEIKNATWDGLLPGGSHWDLLNLNVHDNGTITNVLPDHGLYWTGDHLLLDGGAYHDNMSYGIHIFNSGSTTVSDNVVRNARIYNNNIQGSGGGLILSAGSNNIAYNNVIYNNPNGNGLDISYRCTNCAAYNNTIYGNQGNGIALGAQGTWVLNPILKNNIIFQNGTAIGDGGNSYIASNNFTANPSFTDASHADFTLQKTSTAIGYGQNLSSIFTTDIDGKPRSPMGAFDAGAFAYASTATDTVAPTVSISVIKP